MQYWCFYPNFCLLGEIIFWEGKTKPPSLIPIIWNHSGSLAVFLSTFFIDTFPFPPTKTHACFSRLCRQAPFLHSCLGQRSTHHPCPFVLSGCSQCTNLPSTTSGVPDPFSLSPQTQNIQIPLFLRLRSSAILSISVSDSTLSPSSQLWISPLCLCILLCVSLKINCSVV